MTNLTIPFPVKSSSFCRRTRTRRKNIFSFDEDVQATDVIFMRYESSNIYIYITRKVQLFIFFIPSSRRLQISIPENNG